MCPRCRSNRVSVRVFASAGARPAAAGFNGVYLKGEAGPLTPVQVSHCRGWAVRVLADLKGGDTWPRCLDPSGRCPHGGLDLER